MGDPADVTLLEARLADLADVVARLEGRVAALERSGVAVTGGRRSAVEAALDRSARPPRPDEGSFGAADATRVLSLGGRTLLVLAGAFVLRALTDSGRIPAWMGVGLGFLYAGAWIVMADRAAHAGQALSAGFHAVSVVIIGFPLLFEGATRFRLFSPVQAALLLAALTAAALVLSVRRTLPALAWVVSLGGVATAIALMAAAGRLVPGAVYLVVLGVATLWLGYVRDWTGLRWPVAFVVDLVVLLVALHAVDPATREGPGSALLVQAILVALYLGSFATRTLYMGRKVVPFEMVQSAAVIAVGIGGAIWVAVRSGIGHLGFGVSAVVVAAACYGVAFSFVERRQRIRENFWFYATVALVLALAGVTLLLSGPAQSVAFAVLGLGFGAAGSRRRSRTLVSHAAVYALAAAAGSGLVPRAVATLFVGAAVEWRPGVETTLVLLAAAGTAWLAARVPREGALDRILPVILHVVLALGASGTLVAWIAPAVASGGPGGLATLRTVVLVGAVVAAAAVGRVPAHAEAAWLAYPLLAFTGLKMLLEDLPRGRPATLILAFACYGLALILVPRLRARPRATEVPGRAG